LAAVTWPEVVRALASRAPAPFIDYVKGIGACRVVLACLCHRQTETRGNR